MKQIEFSTEELDNGLAHFVGFHDICPWNNKNSLLAVHQVETDDIKQRTKDDFINIVVWDPKAKTSKVIDTTNCWNWQQGSRLQWLPQTNTIIYNKRENNKAIAKKYNTETSEFEDKINWPIYEISPDGTKALSYSFSRLGEFWKGYGYSQLEPDPGHNEIAPEDDGIYEIDLINNKRKLLIALSQTFQIGRKANFDNFRRFFTHCSYNPSGTKFCFFERLHTDEGALYSRFFIANSNGSDLRLISEGKQSHFDWYDDDHILIWSRPSKSLINTAHKLGILSKPPFKQMIRFIRSLNPSLKSKMTNEYYRLIDINNSNDKVSIARELIKEDGHPMFNKDRTRFVNDTYPNSDAKQELMLIDMKDHTKTSLGWFEVPEKFLDSDLKCDLHPRWDRNNDYVCVDSSHSGKRQVYILKAE